MLRSTGAELRLPFYHGLLAEVCALNDSIGQALANLSNAVAFQNKNGENWSSADLHCLHGDLLLKSGNDAHARATYHKSIEAARQLGSAMCELRAHTRLAELTGDLSKLVELLLRFCEGFDTPDFQHARSLLHRPPET
jgi:hypothetical protein